MSNKLCYLVIALGLLWLVSPVMAADQGKGNILIEEWLNTGGAVTDNVDTLHAYINAGTAPTRSYWAQKMDRPDGGEDYWGGRMRGYIYPPQTGDYTFWTCSDDDSEVWLSTSEDPTKVTMICNVEGWTNYQDWTYSSGAPGTTYKSKAIHLEAGKRYYTEVFFSDGTGGGFDTVAWGGPGIGAGPVVIAGKYIAPWIRDPEPMFLARDPSPADGATGVLSPLLTWTKGGSATFHDLYFGTDPNPPLIGRQAWEMYWNTAGLEPGATYYWRVDEIESDMTTIHKGNLWSFVAAPLAAFSPTPRSGDKWIDPNSDLAWQPGTDAASHDVYFSTDQSLVAARDASVFKGNVAIPSLELPKLNADTTFYWLVDEYDSGGVKHEGEVWSFSTTARTGGVKGEYFNNTAVTGMPSLTRIDPAIDFSWPAGTGPGAPIGNDNFSVRWTADLEITVADTYTFIGTTDDGVRLWVNDNLIIDRWVGKSASDVFSNPITLEPGIYSLRMEYYEAADAASAQLSWQGKTLAREVMQAGPLQPPVRAKPNNPKDGDVNVPQDVTLMWSTGEKAATHEIYFGEDEAAVAAATTADAGIYKGSQAKENNTWTPGALEWNKTYYWKVDEVNAASADSPWTGSVWSFTTANFIVVDDFESYTDEDVGRIFQTWIDGWGYTTPEPGNPGNGTGATVGYIDPPFSEHAIVHGGGSSMPLGYNNADAPNYSEAERTFDSPQNWTVNGVNTLSLQVRGYPQVTGTAVTETGGKMTLTGDGSDIWNNYDDFTFAYKSLNGDASIVARVVSIGPGTNTWAKAGVMIRDSLDGGAMDVYMVMSANSDGAAGNGASFGNRSTTDAVYNTSNDSTVVVAPPYWVKLERMGDTFTGYHSADGSSWTMVGTADVVMSGPVYIGICITSHQPGEQRTFQFEGIKTTGSVTGVWQGALISSPKYNSAQNLYVALQDSAGKVAVVSDATAVNAADWVEVQMPLSSFSGVSMTKVKKMFIGVGDRNSPVADGTGTLFIDDIRVIKP